MQRNNQKDLEYLIADSGEQESLPLLRISNLPSSLLDKLKCCNCVNSRQVARDVCYYLISILQDVGMPPNS